MSNRLHCGSDTNCSDDDDNDDYEEEEFRMGIFLLEAELELLSTDEEDEGIQEESSRCGYQRAGRNHTQAIIGMNPVRRRTAPPKPKLFEKELQESGQLDGSQSDGSDNNDNDSDYVDEAKAKRRPRTKLVTAKRCSGKSGTQRQSTTKKTDGLIRNKKIPRLHASGTEDRKETQKKSNKIKHVKKRQCEPVMKGQGAQGRRAMAAFMLSKEKQVDRHKTKRLQDKKDKNWTRDQVRKQREAERKALQDWKRKTRPQRINAWKNWTWFLPNDEWKMKLLKVKLESSSDDNSNVLSCNFSGCLTTVFMQEFHPYQLRFGSEGTWTYNPAVKTQWASSG